MKKLMLVIGFVGCLMMNAVPASAEQTDRSFGETNMNANTNNYRANATTDDNRRGFDWGWLGLLGLLGLAGARNRSNEGAK